MSERLVLEDVHVSFGRQTILNGVSLRIWDGELCALLGLNGSGKSTLLRAVCGFLPCTCTSMCVDDLSLISMHERERARWLSYIPQRGSTGTGLTVLEIVLMGFNPHLKLLEAPGPTHRVKALATLASLGLSGFEDRLFDQLSEGQRQLVIFARSIVQNAPVMLLDEPDSALDFVHRNQMLAQIAHVVKKERKAGLIALHDPNFAMAYCDRLILLHNGTIAGDISMADADLACLGGELSKLYGRVQVAQWGAQRVMLREL